MGRRRPTRNNEDDLKDMKFDPPDLDGILNLDMYLKWIQTVKRFFEVKGYSDEKSFKVAILKLKKYTSLWYENTNRQRARKGKSRINAWSKLKKLMNKKFLRKGYKRDLYLRVSSLTQGRMSVEEYIREYKQLKIRSRIEKEPEQAIVRFLKGLDQSIAEKVDLQPYWSFEDVCKLAIKVERYSKIKNHIQAHTLILTPHLSLISP